MAKIKTVTAEQAVLDRVEKIRQAVNDRSIEQLTELAPHGFVSDRYRVRAWPILLGLDVDAIPQLDDEDEIDREIEKAAFNRSIIESSAPVASPPQSVSESNIASKDQSSQSSISATDSQPVKSSELNSTIQKHEPSQSSIIQSNNQPSDDESKQASADDESKSESNNQPNNTQSNQSNKRSNEQPSHDCESVSRVAHPYNNEYTSQIDKDVDRSINHFNEQLKWPESRRYRMRLSLNRLINRLFAFNPDLHYIQGFHDIASVFLLSFNDLNQTNNQANSTQSKQLSNQAFSLAFACLNQLATTRLTKSLQPSIQLVLTDLDLLFPLLKQADRELFDCLIENVPQAWFTLSWVLTWFAHNVNNQSIAAHWFDFFLASPTLMPVYVVTAIARANRSELLDSIKQAIDEDNQSESQARVHQFFQHFDTTTHEQVTELALEARSMYELFPPSTLKETSVSKTVPDLTLTQKKSRDLIENLLGSPLTGAIKAVSSTNSVIGSVLLVGAVGVALAWAGPFSRGSGGGQAR